MDVLEKVRAFAAEAHKGQRRKYANEDFINHPVRVMNICREHTAHIPTLAAALLHDVLEDTEVTSKGLRAFLGTVMNDSDADETLQIVTDLTDVYTKASYPQWNRRKRKEEEAKRLEKTSTASQTVRYADIIDNSSDMAEHSEDDFAERFLKECRSLLKRLAAGNRELHQWATEVVNENLQLVLQQRQSE